MYFDYFYSYLVFLSIHIHTTSFSVLQLLSSQYPLQLITPQLRYFIIFYILCLYSLHVLLITPLPNILKFSFSSLVRHIVSIVYITTSHNNHSSVHPHFTSPAKSLTSHNTLTSKIHTTLYVNPLYDSNFLSVYLSLSLSIKAPHFLNLHFAISATLQSGAILFSHSKKRYFLLIYRIL